MAQKASCLSPFARIRGRPSPVHSENLDSNYLHGSCSTFRLRHTVSKGQTLDQMVCSGCTHTLGGDGIREHGFGQLLHGILVSGSLLILLL